MKKNMRNGKDNFYRKLKLHKNIREAIKFYKEWKKEVLKDIR